MKIISRADARSNALTHYFTGNPCVHGHISKRYVSDTACFECHSNKHKKRREKLWKAKTPKSSLAIEKENRENAIKLGLIKYFSIVPCASGHLERYTKNRACVECCVIKGSISHAENRDKNNAERKKRRELNIAGALLSALKYRNANRKQINFRHAKTRRARLKSDPVYALMYNIRSAISKKIKKMGSVKSCKTELILGCSWLEFISHLERQFLEGMSWDNRNLWHIDHIIPISTAKTVEDVISLNHCTNLRPMWAVDNIKKGDKIIFLI